MIEIKPKIHDSNTLEFKVGFITGDDMAHDGFYMNTWVFIPEVLGVNRNTYRKDHFYADTLSYLRFITPYYTLAQVSDERELPYRRLQEACLRFARQPDPNDNKSFQSEIKMFASIVKSSLRDAAVDIMKGAADTPQRCIEFVGELDNIVTRYRALRQQLTDTPTGRAGIIFFDYGDEFLSNIIEQYLGRILVWSKTERPEDYETIRQQFRPVLERERTHRQSMGYDIVDPESPDRNQQFVYHTSQLKKYIESNLYLPTQKRRNTALLEQVVFSLAAGISMVFATLVSFAFQQTYGNFTLPFFIALVISYMFKDRIKDLIRNYFSDNLNSRFYDYLTTIRVNNIVVGRVKDGFDFVQPDDVSRHVSEKRGRKSPLVINKGVDEQVIQYRKYVRLNQNAIKQISDYPVPGINNIFRYNLSFFMRKMDNPQTTLYVNDGMAEAHNTLADKVYYLNFIIQCKYEDQVEYKRYRIRLSRSGIRDIIEMHK